MPSGSHTRDPGFHPPKFPFFFWKCSFPNPFSLHPNPSSHPLNIKELGVLVHAFICLPHNTFLYSWPMEASLAGSHLQCSCGYWCMHPFDHLQHPDWNHRLTCLSPTGLWSQKWWHFLKWFWTLGTQGTLSTQGVQLCPAWKKQRPISVQWIVLKKVLEV